MAAAGRAGSALRVGQQRGSNAARLLSLSDEQEPQIGRAIERPGRHDPRESERYAAFERDEKLVTFPKPFEKARTRSPQGHAIALEEW